MKLRALLRSWALRHPILRSLVERLGFNQPGTWMFQRSNIQDAIHPEVLRQLPFTLRVFGTYCRAYLAVFSNAPSPFGAPQLFRLTRVVRRYMGRPQVLPISLDQDTIHVNVSDPRFINVIAEVGDKFGTEILGRFLSPGDTFVDVGANHGSFSIVAARFLGPDGKILAIEAQPLLAAAVRDSLAASVDCDFEVFSVAVGDQSGEVDLFVPEHSSGSAGMFREYSATSPHHCNTVPLKRFDDLVSPSDFRGQVLMKLDIEGSECAFLRGASDTLKRLHPVILLEIHPEAMHAARVDGQELVETLLSLGYRYYSSPNRLQNVDFLQDLDTSAYGNILVGPDKGSLLNPEPPAKKS